MFVPVRCRILLCTALAFAAAAMLAAGSAAQQPKRPITPADYDAWRTISSTAISPDGKFLAYAVGPVVGDREYVIRNLASGSEWRHRTGGATADAAGASTSPTAPPTTGPGLSPVSPRIVFTPNGRYVVFAVAPTRAELDKARQEGKKSEELPKNAICLQDLQTGNVTRIEGAATFQLAEQGNFLAYRPERAAPTKPVAKPTAASPTEEGEPDDDDKQPSDDGDDQPPVKPVVPPRAPATGSALVLRNLVDQSERKLEDVALFSFTKDGRQLLYTVASRTETSNGIYLLTLGVAAPPLAIMIGKGRYTSLAWDETQTQLGFLSDRDDAASSRPKLKAYVWARQTNPVVVKGSIFGKPIAAATPPEEAASASMPGFPTGWEITDRGGLAFSPDGQLLYLSTAPVKEPSKEPPAAERINLELWHWKDELIVPMQKVRQAALANPSYRAVVHLRERRLVQVSDETLPAINFARNGGWAYGSNDRPYRQLVGFDGNYSDFYLVNLASGQRLPLLQKREGGLSWSPAGKYLLYFDAKHWHSVSVPDGKTTNLTRSLPVNFFREEHDTPGPASSYLFAGWTADDRAVLLYDRYDIWQVAPDGSSVRNLTQGLGRKLGISFRYLSLEPEQRTIDLGKPLFLKAENLETRDQGFYRLHPNGRLEMLLMSARAFGSLLKAKHADLYVFSSSTFYDPPDLYMADGDFKELRKVTDANPQKAHLNWGKAELIKYRSADGVPLSGILIKPEDFDPAKKYPMIVYIYERLSQNLHNFVPPRAGTSINPTYYASNGYLVLMPDIAYTVGYPGQSALKCVMPAIDSVVSLGIVNEKAIGIQGHSWGGYQIAYMITQTDRFAAAAAGAPVSNMTSAYGGIRWGSGLPRQFQYERTQSRIGGSLWQFPMRFVENSPIFMADRVKTPLMMLHNDRDGAVPWYQGIEYYLALRRLQKEVYLFNYVGEDHGLVRRANQRDYAMRMKQFFDHHLKGKPMPEWMAKGEPYRPPPAPTKPTQPATPAEEP